MYDFKREQRKLKTIEYKLYRLNDNISRAFYAADWGLYKALNKQYTITYKSYLYRVRKHNIAFYMQ
jgi:hypothetical protein